MDSSGHNISSQIKEITSAKKFLLRANGVRSFLINIIDNVIGKCGKESKDKSPEQLFANIIEQLLQVTTKDAATKAKRARGFVPCVCEFNNLNQKLLLTGERRTPLFCELCYKSFGSEQGFRLHKLSHLIRTEVFHCPVTGCKVKESQAGRLLAHLRKQHKQDSTATASKIENKLDLMFTNSSKSFSAWERNRMFESDEEEKEENDEGKQDGKFMVSFGKKQRIPTKRKALDTYANDNVSGPRNKAGCLEGNISTTIPEENTSENGIEEDFDITNIAPTILEEITRETCLEEDCEFFSITTNDENWFREKESTTQTEDTMEHEGSVTIVGSNNGNNSTSQHVTKPECNNNTKENEIISSSGREGILSAKVTTEPATITREPLVSNHNDDQYLSGESTKVRVNSNSTKRSETLFHSLQDITSNGGSFPLNTVQVVSPMQILESGWWSKYLEENIVGMRTERVDYKPSMLCGPQTQCAELSVTNNINFEKHLVVFHQSEQLMYNPVYQYPSVAPPGAVSLANATARVENVLKYYLIIVFDGKEDFKGLNLDMEDFNVFDLSEYFQQYSTNRDGVVVPEKISLKRLVKFYFGADIQTGKHSSMEDAIWTRRLFGVYTRIHPKPCDRDFKDYFLFSSIPDNQTN